MVLKRLKLPKNANNIWTLQNLQFIWKSIILKPLKNGRSHRVDFHGYYSLFSKIWNIVETGFSKIDAQVMSDLFEKICEKSNKTIWIS